MKIFASIAFVLAIIMVALDLTPSWSQYAGTLEEPLLLGTLVCIGYSFILRSTLMITSQKKVIGKITSGKMDLVTAILFGCILIFPVTHDNGWISMFHMIFTALAILVAYINLILQQTTKLMKLSTRIGFMMVVVIFLVGFLTPLWTTAVGELCAALPLAIHIWTTKRL